MVNMRRHLCSCYSSFFLTRNVFPWVFTRFSDFIYTSSEKTITSDNFNEMFCFNFCTLLMLPANIDVNFSSTRIFLLLEIISTIISLTGLHPMGITLIVLTNNSVSIINSFSRLQNLKVIEALIKKFTQWQRQ